MHQYSTWVRVPNIQMSGHAIGRKKKPPDDLTLSFYAYAGTLQCHPAENSLILGFLLSSICNF